MLVFFYFYDGTRATTAILRNHLGDALAGSTTLIDHVHHCRGFGDERWIDVGGSSWLLAGHIWIRLFRDHNTSLQRGIGDLELAECFQFAFRIDSVSFAHCPREANKVSHCLARNSYDSDSVVFRDGDPPSFLLAELVHDVTVFWFE